MSCAMFNAAAFVYNVLLPHVFFFLSAEIAGKVHALLPHVAEDEIRSDSEESSEEPSEESDVEVDVVCVPAVPLVDGDVLVDELDVYQLTDEQLLQRLAETCEAADPSHPSICC